MSSNQNDPSHERTGIFDDSPPEQEETKRETKRTGINLPADENWTGINEDVELTPPPQSDQKDQKLGFLHWSSVFFDLATLIRQQFIPLAISFFVGQSLGLNIVIWIVALTATIQMIYSLYSYFTLKYRVVNKKLVIETGWIFKTVRTIPIEKIQNLDLVQRIAHRIFRVAEVRIETAGGTGVEAVLKVLTLSQVEELKQWIYFKPILDQKQARSNPDSTQSGTSLSASELGTNFAFEPNHLGADQNEIVPSLEPANSHSIEEEPQSVLRIPSSRLVKAGIASNQGLVFLGAVISTLYNYGSERIIQNIPEYWLSRFRWLENLTFNESSPLTFVGIIAALLLIVFLITRITGVIWYVLRFGGYRLDRKGDDLQISFGLWTKISATVPRHRIQFVSVQKPLLFRLFGYSVIRIETAGGADEKNQNSGIVRECFVPVIDDELVPKVLEQIRSGLQFPNPETGNWVGLSPKATRRKLRGTILLIIILSLLAYLVWSVMESFFIFLPLIVGFPLMIYWAVKSSKSVKYLRTNEGLIYRSGIFVKKISIAFRNRIQAIHVSQSILDRRWSMAKLSVDTAAAGPAKHAIDIGYLDKTFAEEELEHLRPFISKALIPPNISETLPFHPSNTA